MTRTSHRTHSGDNTVEYDSFANHRSGSMPTQAELLRLRKATYVAEQKLSAEVLIRMQLEEA